MVSPHKEDSPSPAKLPGKWTPGAKKGRRTPRGRRGPPTQATGRRTCVRRVHKRVRWKTRDAVDEHESTARPKERRPGEPGRGLHPARGTLRSVGPRRPHPRPDASPSRTVRDGDPAGDRQSGRRAFSQALAPVRTSPRGDEARIRDAVSWLGTSPRCTAAVCDRDLAAQRLTGSGGRMVEPTPRRAREVSPRTTDGAPTVQSLNNFLCNRD